MVLKACFNIHIYVSCLICHLFLSSQKIRLSNFVFDFKDVRRCGRTLPSSVVLSRVTLMGDFA